MIPCAFHMNLGSIARLPHWSAYNAHTIDEQILLLKKHGFSGVQTDNPLPYVAAGMDVSTYGRIITTEDADRLITQ